MPEKDEPPVAFIPEKLDQETDLLYESIGFRRQTVETMVWQAPVLSLTAQAFLMIISLGPDSSILARAISSIFSIAVSLASVHTMAKHREYEFEDARWCAEYERRRWGQQRGNKPAPHDRLSIFASKSAFLRMRAFWVWTNTLLLFALISLAILVAACIPCFHAIFDQFKK